MRTSSEDGNEALTDMHMEAVYGGNANVCSKKIMLLFGIIQVDCTTGRKRRLTKTPFYYRKWLITSDWVCPPKAKCGLYMHSGPTYVFAYE
jgi:hypothetical protein